MALWNVISPDGTTHIVTAEDALAFLSSIRIESEQIGVTVTLEEQGGQRWVTVGIGRPYCFVNYHRSDDPPYYSSVDTSGFADEGLAVFDCGGTPTEIPIRNCINRQTMLAAVASLLESDALPTVCAWEED